MISKQTSKITGYIERGRRTKLLTLLNRLISVDNITYKNELADGTVKAVLESVDWPKYDIEQFDKTEGATAAKINDIIEKHRECVNTLYSTFANNVGELNSVSKTLAEANQNVTKSTADVNKITDQVESELKAKGSQISISDERIVFNTFDNNSQVDISSLTLDSTSGVLLLKPDNNTLLRLTIESIEVNKPKMRIKTTAVAKKLDSEVIEPGYYCGYFYSNKPRFEYVKNDNLHYDTVPTTMLDALTDSDPYTNLEIEYCTKEANDELTATYTLKLEREVNVTSLSISTNNQGSSANVKVEKVEALIGGEYLDITNRIYGKGVSTHTIFLPSGSNEITLSPNDEFPRDNIYIQVRSTSKIRVTLKQDKFVPIQFPIISLLDNTRSIVRTMNYLESLIVINNYKNKLGIYNPYLNNSKRDQILTVQDKANTIEENSETLNRYFIAVRDIDAYSSRFAMEGTFISTWYTISENSIAIELYVDEYISRYLDHNSIKYSIGIGSLFYDIWPSNRRNSKGIPERYIFKGNPVEGEKFIAKVPTRIRLRVDMRTSDNTVSPLLHGYAIRVKTEAKR